MSITNTETIFEQLSANALVVLKGYESDLLHDQRWMNNNPGTPFLHIARATGTHLFELPDCEALLTNVERPYLFGVATPAEIYQGVARVLTAELQKDGRVFQVFDSANPR